MNRFRSPAFTLCKWCLGAVMLTAAISKIVGFQEFTQFLAVVPFHALSDHALGVAKLVIALELALGIGCLAFADCTLTSLVAVVLLVLFTAFQLAMAKFAANSPGCPCLISPLLREFNDSLAFRLTRNVVLLLLAVATYYLSRDEGKPQPIEAR